jgi:hypothetical protein
LLTTRPSSGLKTSLRGRGLETRSTSLRRRTASPVKAADRLLPRLFSHPDFRVRVADTRSRPGGDTLGGSRDDPSCRGSERHKGRFGSLLRIVLAPCFYKHRYRSGFGQRRLNTPTFPIALGRKHRVRTRDDLLRIVPRDPRANFSVSEQSWERVSYAFGRTFAFWARSSGWIERPTSNPARPFRLMLSVL